MIKFFNEDSKEEFFDDFFYQSIDDGKKVYNVATIANIRGDEDTQELLKQVAGIYPGGVHKLENLSLKQLLTAYKKVSVDQIINFSRNGLASEKNGIDYRPLRPLDTFAGQREKQLLKQLSTMIYFHMASKKSVGIKDQLKLVEIETMHIRYNGKSFIFIAGNEASATEHFEEIFNSDGSLKEKLKKHPTSMPTDQEGKNRVERYSNNFKKIFNKELPFDKTDNDIDRDIKYYNEIGKLLKNSKTSALKLSYNSSSLLLENASDIKNILNNSDRIFFIDSSKIPRKLHSRHAEEFLVDIAEIIKQHAKEKILPTHICIAGKKRPCTTCYARMKSSRIIDSYGNYPGFFWIGRYKEQVKMNPEAARTAIVTLSEKPTNVTSYPGANDEREEPGYDSGTDTEDPTIKKNSKLQC